MKAYGTENDKREMHHCPYGCCGGKSWRGSQSKGKRPTRYLKKRGRREGQESIRQET